MVNDNYNGVIIKWIFKGWLSFIAWLVKILDTVYLQTPYLWRVRLPVALFFTTEVGQNPALPHFTKVGNLLVPLVG
jgi:hypothetical protein